MSREHRHKPGGRKRGELLATSVQSADSKTAAVCTERAAFEFLRNRAAVDGAHLEHVLHFDDAALQDGGTHRWDLDGATVPRLPASGAHNITAQCAHHRALLLHGAAGDERLCLGDVGFRHN